MNGRMFGDFVCAGVLAFVAFGAQASAQRCTWTGAGGDRKWSTAANWDVLPVSGRGDTVVLRSCAGEAVDVSPIEIDVAGMSVATLEIGDSAGPYGPVTLTGNALEVTGNKPWLCYETVTNYAPIVFSSATEATLYCSSDVHFFGNVAVNSTLLECRTEHNGASRNIHFHAAVEASRAVLSAYKVGSYFYGPVHFARIKSGVNSTSDWIYFNSAGSDCPLVEISYFGRVFANAPYSLPANSVLSWQYDYPGNTGQSQAFELNGDQLVDRIAGAVPTKGDGTVLLERKNIVNAKTTASTLTLKATDHSVTYAQCNGMLSIVYDPVGDFVQAFCDRTHLMTGTLRVKGGTLASLGANSFPAVARLTIDSGAAFRIAESEFSAAANPFSGTTDLFISGSGVLEVSAGVTATFGRVFIDGLIVPQGTYQSQDGNDATAKRVRWISGGGLVSASTMGTSWKKAGAGKWSDPENWSNGVPAQDVPAYFDSAASGACEAQLSGGDVWPLSLELSGDGAVVSVPAGESVCFDGLSKAARLSLVDGARIKVDGELVLTNYSGSFVVESSLAATSGVVVAGNFFFAPDLAAKSNPIRLRPGGALFAAGGMISFSHSSRQAVEMEGGALYASGSGMFNAFGSVFRFNAGDAVFAGDSQFCWAMPAEFAVTAGPVVQDNELNVRFCDRSRLDSLKDMTEFTVGGTAENAKTRIAFASDAVHERLGYGAKIYATGTEGAAEMSVEAGVVVFGGRGCDIACAGNGLAPRSGCLRLAGGTITNTASHWWLDSYKPVGLTVAYGLSTAEGGVSGAVDGSFAVSGGEFVNKTSVLLIGTGPGAYGRMVMTGGRFNNCDPSQIAGVGYAGGRGEIVVSNGTLAVAGDMYLGGSFTNVFTTNPDKPFRNWPFGRHDAVGELTVAGGCVSVGKNLVLGADGTGRAVVCGGTLEVAGSLVCSNAAENAASGAELVFDLEGCESFSPLAVGGCLDVRNGARVVVRVGSGTCLMRPIALLRANGILGEIGDLDVGIDGAQAGVGKLEAYVKGGVLGVRLRKGLIIHVK